jgi:hypothetical protein
MVAARLEGRFWRSHVTVAGRDVGPHRERRAASARPAGSPDVLNPAKPQEVRL